MKIIYISKTLSEQSFELCQQKAKSKINPSNQHFHIKVLKALTIKNDVEAISLVPFKQANIGKKEYDCGICFHYVYRGESVNKTIENILKELLPLVDNNTVLLFDSSSYLLMKASKRIDYAITNRLGLVLTDNPNNITGMNPFIKRKLIKSYQNFDFYLALTECLCELTNRSKPHVVIPGIAEDKNIDEIKNQNPYFFYGGSLYEKYGVLNLINAFEKGEFSKEFDLVICGHGPLEKELLKISENNPRIKYHPLLEESKYLSLVKGAIACINPRPINDKLDANSFPSKVMEYLSYNGAVISNQISCLNEVFKDEIIWTKNNDENSLVETMKNAAKRDETKCENIRNNVLKTYGFTAFSDKMQQLIDSLF